MSCTSLPSRSTPTQLGSRLLEMSYCGSFFFVFQYHKNAFKVKNQYIYISGVTSLFTIVEWSSYSSPTMAWLGSLSHSPFRSEQMMQKNCVCNSQILRFEEKFERWKMQIYSLSEGVAISSNLSTEPSLSRRLSILVSRLFFHTAHVLRIHHTNYVVSKSDFCSELIGIAEQAQVIFFSKRLMKYFHCPFQE